MPDTSAAGILQRQVGLFGSTGVSHTNLVTGQFGCLSIVKVASFSSFTGDNMGGFATGDGMNTYPIGFNILGQVNAFTLTSGALIAYRR